jgi:DNA-binding SARP family transcriptional activator
VRSGGERLDLGGRMPRLLLALLLLRADEVVSSDSLVDDLWGEQTPRTAPAALHVHVSNLRRALSDPELLETRSPGYVLHPRGAFDLRRFEQLVAAAEATDAREAAEALRDALRLWRGSALADLRYEPALQMPIARLEELRLTALERRIEADLALGRHAQLVAELQALADEHRFRETLHAQLMVALYRSGRQAEALAAYRVARAQLADELGLEPGPELRRLEQAILAQDPALDVAAATPVEPSKARQPSVLLLLDAAAADEPLLILGRLLATHVGAELVLVCPLGADVDVRAVTATLHQRRDALLSIGIPTRAAAFTSPDPISDLGRLARRIDVTLVLAARVEALAAEAPCSLAVLFPRAGPLADAGPIIAPFGGGEHDWAAIEVAAWLAVASGAELQLAGRAGDYGSEGDASLALADASLAIQYALGVAAQPLLLPRREDTLLAAAHDARLLVVGLSDRWRSEGVGTYRRRLAEEAHSPVLLVRRGLRPSGLAPAESLIRFTWSLPVMSGR